RPLVRVVLDRQVRLSPESRLATTTSETPVLVFGDPESAGTAALRAQGVEIVNAKHRDLQEVLRELGSRSLQSVLVEGGSTIAGEFLDAGLVNKVSVFIAPKIVGGADAPGAIGGRGVEAMSEALELKRVTVVRQGEDIEVTGYPRKGSQADEG